MEESKGESCKGAHETSEGFLNYIRGHDMALNFAKRNRFLIAHRILQQIDSRKITVDQEFSIKETDCIVDIYHNFVEKIPVLQDDGTFIDSWIHRKGATPSN